MCVRFHVCDIECGWFLVRDSVARWANFSYAILPVREMCLQCTCSWPWPCLSKQRMASREQEILLVVLRRRQKVSLNQTKLAIALSCSYVNFIPHDFLSDMVAVDSVHGHASLLWQEPGNPTRGMPWRQGIPGRIPLTHAVAHGNAFSRTRYCAHMEMYFLIRDIAHWNSRAISRTWKTGLTQDVLSALTWHPLIFHQVSASVHVASFAFHWAELWHSLIFHSLPSFHVASSSISLASIFSCGILFYFTHFHLFMWHPLLFHSLPSFHVASSSISLASIFSCGILFYFTEWMLSFRAKASEPHVTRPSIRKPQRPCIAWRIAPQLKKNAWTRSCRTNPSTRSTLGMLTNSLQRSVSPNRIAVFNVGDSHPCAEGFH